MKLLKPVIIACLLAALSVQPAHALLDKLFGKKQAVQKSMPLTEIYPIQDEAAFQAVAKSFHKMPFNDPLLEFNILLPKDWTQEETLHADTGGEFDRKIMGELGRFRSPFIHTMQALVTIQSIRVEREISAENWLKNYILTNNCSLQGAVAPDGNKEATAACVSTSEGRSTYLYVLAKLNGNNAVVVQFEMPIALKEGLDFLSKRVLDSFQFVLTSDRPIETQRIFNFASTIKFGYPESWIPNHIDARDTKNMSMQLYSKQKNDLVDGLVRFVVARRSDENSLKKEALAVRKHITEFLGLDIKKLISSDKLPASNRFLFSRYEVYQVTPRKEGASSQELRLAVLGDKDWYVFVFLLSPSDNDDFYTWACNTQAFDIIVKSLR
jgi:hypothetical protein